MSDRRGAVLEGEEAANDEARPEEVQPRSHLLERGLMEFLGEDEGDEGDNWLVDGVLPEEAVSLLGGEIKSGKSYLLAYIALCVAAGIPFLGRATKQGRVLLFLLEDRRRDTRVRLRALFRGHGIDPAQIGNSLELGSREADIRLDDPASVRELDRLIRDVKPAVVFLDCLRRVHQQDENSMKEMTPVMRALDILANKHGCAIVVLHHFVKPRGGRGGRVVNRNAGSNVITSYPRQIIGVEKMSFSEEEWSLKITAEGNGEPAVLGARFVHDKASGSTTAVAMDPTAAKRQAAKRAKVDAEEGLRDAILVALTGGPMTRDQLRDAVKRRKGTVCAAVKELAAAGLVVDEGDRGRVRLA